MSLDKIQLPNFLILALFKHTLVITDDIKAVNIPQKAPTPPLSPTKKIAEEPPKKLFLGDNKKKITIIVKDSEVVYLREEWLQFLTTILGACKLNIGDVAIINLLQSNLTFADLQLVTTPKYIIMFDCEAKDIALPISVSNYEVKEYNNCSLLFCSPLSVMFGNTEAVKLEKTKLWVSLKRMFNL